MDYLNNRGSQVILGGYIFLIMALKIYKQFFLAVHLCD